jgi:hypothetical protein
MPAPRRLGRGAGGVTVTGIAAPHPLRRHSLPVAGPTAIALAACEGGSNAGGPHAANVASSSASTYSSASHERWPSPGACGRPGSRISPPPTPMAAPAVAAASTSAVWGSS